jgi:hypothetical protein
MGSNRTTFEKQQRDRAKKAKADAKRDRRQGRESEERPAYRPAGAATAEGPLSVSAIRGEVSAEQLLQLVEALHRRFENEEITFEEFEEEKAELFSRLSID